MREQGLSQIYARYVPRLIVERLLREARAVDAPSSEDFQGAILFADISGFTPLTEAFAAQGPAGAEALTRILNDYFGRMTRIVADHGGDVLKFAGDALMALWTPGADDPRNVDACLRATRCGLELQASLAGYQAESHTLSLRVAVGVGSGVVVHIGGQFNRWEFAVAGSPLNQVGRVGTLAAPGDVLVSPEVWALINRHATGTPVLDEEGDPERTEIPPWRIEELSETVAAVAAPPAPELPRELEDALRGYLPASITRRIMAGQTDFLGELRRLTILFVNLPDLRHDTPLEDAQKSFRALQRALYFPWEGSINKLSVDDKGISLVAALGLPPFAHEDDAARGAQAAMAMHAALSELGQRCSIGVATGRVYCGSVGGGERQEYTIMGDRVNLAARLMQNADGHILCDQATVDRSEAIVQYSEPQLLKVKGKSLPLPVFRPLGQRVRAGPERSADIMIGRVQEAGILTSAVEALVESGSRRCIYIEGEAGVGKSRLVEHFAATLDDQPVRLLQGAGDAIEQSTSYFAWQAVLLGLFGLEGESSNRARRERIENILSKDVTSRELLPLLNAILPLDIPENDLTRQMSGEVRASNLQTLLVNLLQFSTTRKPLVLILDDVHWMDSASWEALLNVVQQVPRALIVLGSRPVALTDAPEALKTLLQLPETETIRLERMHPDECVALVARRLKVDSLPDAAAELIRQRGEGHPFFSEEIGYALRDAGVLKVDNGQASMSEESVGMLEGILPDTIEGIITSRIDRLSPQQQLALKVASCIGRVFSFRILQGVYPISQDRAQLVNEMEGLATLDLTPLEAPEPEHAYIFKHAITRQVAYDLMLYAQRQQLHEAIALWYEEQRSSDISAYYALLAYHWSRTDNDAKAVHYLERAAEQAARANANPEVVEFIEEAINRSRRLDTPPSALRQARWLALLGAAKTALGRLDEARADLEKALIQCGYPAPGSTQGLVAAILTETAAQTRHRLRPRPPKAMDQDAQDRLELAASIIEQLFIIYFFGNDAGRMLWSCLRSTNLSERIGRVTPTLVRSYTNMAITLAAIPLRKQVSHYGDRAISTASELDSMPAKAWAGVGTSAAIVATGEWEELERRSNEGIEINRALGDMRRWEEASANLALIRTIYGRFDEPEDSLYLPVLEAARKRRIRQTEGWGLTIWGINLQYLQRFEELEAIVEQLKPWYEQASDGMDDIARLEAVDLMALSGLRRGDEEDSRHWLDQGFALLAGLGRPSQYRNLPATYLLGEAAIEHWLAATNPAESRAREQRVRKVIRAMRSISGIFPIGLPRQRWIEGRLHRARGRDAAAEKAWRACLDAATPLAMEYDRFLASGGLAELLGKDSEAGRRFAALHAELSDQLRLTGSTFIPRSAP